MQWNGDYVIAYIALINSTQVNNKKLGLENCLFWRWKSSHNNSCNPLFFNQAEKKQHIRFANTYLAKITRLQWKMTRSSSQLRNHWAWHQWWSAYQFKEEMVINSEKCELLHDCYQSHILFHWKLLLYFSSILFEVFRSKQINQSLIDISWYKKWHRRIDDTYK